MLMASGTAHTIPQELKTLAENRRLIQVTIDNDELITVAPKPFTKNKDQIWCNMDFINEPTVIEVRYTEEDQSEGIIDSINEDNSKEITIDTGDIRPLLGIGLILRYAFQ